MVESSDDYETLEEYVEKLFSTRDTKTIDWISFLLERRALLGMSGIENEDFVATGIS